MILIFLNENNYILWLVHFYILFYFSSLTISSSSNLTANLVLLPLCFSSSIHLSICSLSVLFTPYTSSYSFLVNTYCVLGFKIMPLYTVTPPYLPFLNFLDILRPNIVCDRGI